jgi:hypothetical protein
VRFVLNAKGIPFEEIKLDLLAARAQEVHRSFLTIPRRCSHRSPDFKTLARSQAETMRR